VPGQSGDPDFMLSLARGLSVIRAFAEGRQRLSVAEVARLAKLSRAAARRCLYTLSVLGYARVSEGMYELTPAVLTLGHAYLGAASIARVAQPVLDRVSAEIHEPCSLAVLDGDEIVFVAVAAARAFESIDLAIGSRLPAFCTSMGRVLVANTDSASRDRFVTRLKPVRRTPHTVVDKSQLRAELARVKGQGFAVLDQESHLGWRSLAVPVLRSGVAVAAVNVAVQATTADPQTLERDMLPVLKAAAEEIGSALSPEI
jgi:IclR family pca regulon transcriptional regulator